MADTLSIKFYLNTAKTTGDKTKIYCRIIADRKKSEFYTGFGIKEEFWNAESGRAYPDSDLNNEMTKIESKIYDIRRSILDSGLALTASNIVDYYKLKNTKTQRDHLNEDEIELLKKHHLNKNIVLQKIRDFFLFSCYTGLRFNDAYNLKMDDIVLDENGINIISIQMGKTNDYVQIPLIKEAMEIIKKYNSHPDREVLNFE